MVLANRTGRIWGPRVRLLQDSAEAAEVMRAIGADEPGVRIMTAKSMYRHIYLEQVPIPASQILKEEMLSAGGEAVRAKGAVSSAIPHTDILLMGTERHYSRVIKKLRMQPFGLKALADELTELLAAFAPAASMRLLSAGGRSIALGARTLVMGILNLTPDSFSGDGILDSSGSIDIAAAITRAEGMIADGADIIDIGGESSRPGARPVSTEEELARVLPVIQALSAHPEAFLSIDTYKSEVARAAVAGGAHMVNDISGLRMDEGMAETIASTEAAVVLMHMKGTPETMQSDPSYRDVVGEVISSLRESVSAAGAAGIPRDRLVVDVGIGFGKTAAHNLEILRRLGEFGSLNLPVLVGTSRKAFIGKVLGGAQVDDRLEGTAATVALSVAGGADIVRVHDVKQMARVVRMTDAIIGRRTDAE